MRQKNNILTDQGDLRAQFLGLDGVQVPTIPENSAGGWGIKTQQEIDQAAFARAAGSSQPELEAFWNSQLNVLQNVIVPVIEIDLVEG